MNVSLPLIFSARTERGAGRGRRLKTPTINLDLQAVPDTLPEGIYAARVTWENAGTVFPAAMHYGPRPVFKDSRSCEVHLLDQHVENMPPEVTVTVVAFLREVLDFPSVGALMEQIAEDIRQTRRILESSGS